MDIKRLKTTAYMPSTNGKIERWHRSLNAMMAKVIDVKQKRWTEFLPFIVAAYNNSVHSSTTFTPNFLMFGRNLLTPIDIAVGISETEVQSPNDYAQHVRNSLAEAHEIVRQHWGQRCDVIKRQYDLSVKPVEFKEGDQVWYFCPRTKRGTSSKWSKYFTGPHEVTGRLNDVNYIIRLKDGRRSIVVHVNKLKPYAQFNLR